MAADEECSGINLKLSYESYLDDEDDDDADAADDYNGFFFSHILQEAMLCA